MRFSTPRFIGALIATNLKACFALRGAFWLQAVAMALNNAFFFIVWWIFFDRFDEIRGWRVGDVALLYGIVATAYGLAVVFAGGIRELARRIIDGELDSLLTQPKNVLVHAAASRSVASGWGDIASGILFVALSGRLDLETVPVALVAVTASSTVFISCGILIHSAAFWLGRVESLARQLWEFLITFSLYPRPLFAGALKLLLFTALPAGFVGHLPADLVRDFSAGGLALTLGGTLLYAGLAVLVFSRGLHRYESGNRFGVRA